MISSLLPFCKGEILTRSSMLLMISFAVSANDWGCMIFLKKSVKRCAICGSSSSSR